MMDESGIDAAWLTSAQGMCADAETSRLVNDKAKKAERDYPGRFIGAAHAHPLGGAEALKETQPLPGRTWLSGCRHHVGNRTGSFSTIPRYEPFWTEAARLGMFVFVHPALKLNFSQQFDGFDTARSVGREFSLIMATIRLVNSGVFDRHPGLMVHMAHLSGGIASMLGRIRSYQDKDFWGTKGNPRHGMNPEKDFDHYLRNNMVFDTAGFAGAISSVKTALVEIPSDRIVFATDYPQEIPRAFGRSGIRGRAARARTRRRDDFVGECGEAVEEVKHFFICAIPSR